MTTKTPLQYRPWLTLAALCLFSTAAAAETVPLDQSWSVERTWYLRTTVEPTEPVALADTMGRVAYVDRYEVRIYATCDADDSKRRTVLDCDIDNALVSASSADGQNEAMDAVLGELEVRLERADVQVTMSRSGAVKRLVMDESAWWEAGLERARASAEILASAAFEGLDQPMPRRAVERRAWRAASAWHAIDDYDGERAIIRTRGGDEYTQTSGQATYDVEARTMAERKWFSSKSDAAGRVQVAHGYARLVLPVDSPWAIANADDTASVEPIIEASLPGSTSAR